MLHKFGHQTGLGVTHDMGSLSINSWLYKSFCSWVRDMLTTERWTDIQTDYVQNGLY